MLEMDGDSDGSITEEELVLKFSLANDKSAFFSSNHGFRFKVEAFLRQEVFTTLLVNKVCHFGNVILCLILK